MCREHLTPAGTAFACENHHSFDRARQGYVNLLIAGQRRSRQPGDSKEMVAARRRFLATGAYDRIGDVVAHVAGRALAGADGPGTVLDVGCGEGHHTRRVARNMAEAWLGADRGHPSVAGIDVSKHAVALAAAADPEGSYAVASAGDLPIETASVDAVLSIFGPVVPGELARVVRTGGSVIAVHPGPQHLEALRALVYEVAEPHSLKPPLRGETERFATGGAVAVTFPITITDAGTLADLYAMTPYRWHAPPDIDARLAAAVERGFTATVDVIVTSYVRRATRP